MAVLSLVSIMNIQPLSSRQGDLTTFDSQFCPACRIINNKVVKSPPVPPPVPGWGEVGHYFDKYINKPGMYSIAVSTVQTHTYKMLPHMHYIMT